MSLIPAGLRLAVVTRMIEPPEQKEEPITHRSVPEDDPGYDPEGSKDCDNLCVKSADVSLVIKEDGDTKKDSSKAKAARSSLRRRVEQRRQEDAERARAQQKSVEDRIRARIIGNSRKRTQDNGKSA